MKRFALPLLLTLTLILAACSTAPSAEPPPIQPFDAAPPSGTTQGEPAPVSPTAAAAAASPTGDSTASSELTRSDQQGMVTVDITPLNLTSPGDTLEFDIALNTHSVDLSMDLAILATLTSDTGITIQPTLWDAPRGGHHVEGTLIFPAAVDGKPVLEGAARLTLTITNLDVPSRVFEWQLK